MLAQIVISAIPHGRSPPNSGSTWDNTRCHSAVRWRGSTFGGRGLRLSPARLGARRRGDGRHRKTWRVSAEPTDAACGGEAAPRAGAPNRGVAQAGAGNVTDATPR